MKRILVTIANHVYDFEIDVPSNGTPNTVRDYLIARSLIGYSNVAMCNLIYDVTAQVPVKSRYEEKDLTREAIAMLLYTSKKISHTNLQEAVFKAYPNI